MTPFRPGPTRQYNPFAHMGSRPPDAPGIYHILDHMNHPILEGTTDNLNRTMHELMREGKMKPGCTLEFQQEMHKPAPPHHRREPEPKPGPGGGPGHHAGPRPEGPKPGPKAGPKPKTKPRPKPGPKPGSKPHGAPRPDHGPERGPKSEMRPENRPASKSGPATGKKQGGKPGFKGGPKRGQGPKPKPDAKPEKSGWWPENKSGAIQMGPKMWHKNDGKPYVVRARNHRPESGNPPGGKKPGGKKRP